MSENCCHMREERIRERRARPQQFIGRVCIQPFVYRKMAEAGMNQQILFSRMVMSMPDWGVRC